MPGHPEDCRCGDCWPFRPGSEAERSWAAGERVSRAARITVRQPRPVERVGGFLPGDLEIQAARLETARALDSPVPSRLGCGDGEEGTNGSEAPDDDHGAEASLGPEAS